MVATRPAGGDLEAVARPSRCVNLLAGAAGVETLHCCCRRRFWLDVHRPGQILLNPLPQTRWRPAHRRTGPRQLFRGWSAPPVATTAPISDGVHPDQSITDIFHDTHRWKQAFLIPRATTRRLASFIRRPVERSMAHHNRGRDADRTRGSAAIGTTATTRVARRAPHPINYRSLPTSEQRIPDDGVI